MVIEEKSNIKEELIQTIKSLSSRIDPVPTGFKTRILSRINPRVLIFDIYGTLFISGSGDISVSSKNVEINKLKTLLDKYGINESPERLSNRFVSLIEKKHNEARETKGIDYPEVVVEEIWKELLGLDNQILAKKFSLEYELLTNPVWPMPGLDKLLQLIKKNSLIAGIISNAQFYTPLLFEAFCGDRLEELGFNPELLILSYKEGVAKPSLKIFEIALLKLRRNGFNPDDVLYMGNDMLNDIYPAKKVGFKTALFTGDKRSLRLREENPKIKNLHPDVFISNLLDLKNIF